MDFIKGYKPTTYSELQKEVSTKFAASEKKLPDLAVAAEVDSTNTIQFAINSETQKVSDRVLTSVYNSLGIAAFVLWINGEKHYFVKSKN